MRKLLPVSLYALLQPGKPEGFFSYQTKCLLTAFICCCLQLIATAQQPAFPGAEGGGRMTTGGRGASVYEVTNLNDAGAGSLRDAISQSNRTVVFRVSGVISLKSALRFSKDNITVAGQTAPGDGICITGYTVQIRANNLIIRYLRCRLGDDTKIEDDAMNGFSGTIAYQNIIIDHCSLGWSVDETGTFYGVRDFTLQWCILSESLYHSVHDKGDHGYAGIWGGQNASFHHNLLAHHTSRCPRFCGSRYTGRPDLEVVDFRNNVIYNWGNINSTYGGEGGNYNMVNNYYKPGPATPGSTTSSATNKRNRILNYTSYYYSSDAAVYPDTLFGGKFYIVGNEVNGYPDVSADNWTKGVQKDGYAKADSLMNAARQQAPFPVTDINTQTAANAYLSVLDNAGAILPKRDVIDKRIINETRTGTASFEGSTYAAINSPGITHPSGILDTQADAGGLPAYQQTPPPADTDHDGMPDAWESANGLNPNDAADGNATAANGYTNLENYLNGIAAGPDITVFGTTAGFSQVLGTPSALQTYTVAGTNLSGNISITPPAGFEVSANNGITWYSEAAPLVLSAVGGTVATTTVSVHLNVAVTGTFAGNMVHASIGAGTILLPVSGTATAPLPAGINAVVAQDGTGNYTSVQAAIDAAPVGRTIPYLIYIRNGKYKEKITIPANKPFIHLMGESAANTILTFDAYSGKSIPGGGTYGTSTSATVTVNANDFAAFNITFENSTGYTGDGPQALAINVSSDRVVFKNCRFIGGQDTVLANGNGKRQYFNNCYIDGNTDFIFGSSIVVFDSCIIYPRDRVDGSSGGYITAANTPQGQLYGYVFRDCKITMNRGVTTYTLGRPWQNDASTADAAKSNNKVVFLNTIMARSVRPEGWSIWDAGTNTALITYAEYNSRRPNGTPVDISGRVSWSKQLSEAEAMAYTLPNIFGNWDPCTLSAAVCVYTPPVVAISNFKGKKGTSTVPSLLTWNLSWPIPGISYELFRSTDRKSFSTVNTQTTPGDTLVSFSYSDATPPPGVTYYYFIRASKTGLAAHVTDTISISSTPAVTVSGNLGSFAQSLGAPSAPQAYVVSGAYLLDNMIITPPVNFEVSANGGTTWFTSAMPLILTQNGGTVNNTTITVRLNAATAGTSSGTIIHASTGADTVNIPVTGTTAVAPLKTSSMLQQWPLITGNTDSAAVRSPGINASTPVFSRLVLSNGTTLPNIPAYSPTFGQAFAASSDGFWISTTPVFGPGGNLSRTFYEQFTVTPAPDYLVRVDSISLNAAFISTVSNTKLAVVFSKTGFTTADSVNVTGGMATLPPAEPVPLLSTANGGFATPVLLASQPVTGPTNNYTFALNGTDGITIAAGQTLTIRLYFSCGSTSNGRYAVLKNVLVKGGISSAGPLPLTLVSINGAFNGHFNELKWQTTHEVNTMFFIIEKSANGNSFSETAKVFSKSAAGTHDYRYTDSTAGIGVAYYRLKMVNRDGSYTYSSIIRINGNTAIMLKVFPNPALDVLELRFPALKGMATLQLLNPEGKQLKLYKLPAGSTQLAVPIGMLARGLYLLRLTDGTGETLTRFVK